MREKIIRFFKMWTLPLGMCAGFAVYFLFRYIPWLAPLKALANGANDHIMPFFIFVMLFPPSARSTRARYASRGGTW